MRKFKLFSVVLSLFLVMATSAHAVPVALELVLGVDVSGSVDNTEYALQKQGYINAFNNITAFGAFSPFAVTYFEWSGASEQSQLVGWTLINNAADAAAFATAIGATSRAFGGLTAVGSAINFGATLFANGYEGTRMVMDISGDGSENDGATTKTASNNAFADGVTINGLPILGSESGLDTWYTNNVITPNGFIVVAADFNSFETAVFQKLQQEIVPTVPEPGTMLLMGLGAAGAAFMRKRRKA